MAPPLKSMNAAKHCLTVTHRAAKMGDRTYRRLPKRLKYIQEEACKYASALFADREADGEPVTREEWEAIQAAAAWELHRLNVLRVLRTDSGATPEKDIQRSAELAKAQEKRAMWVKQLGLRNPASQDPWASLQHVPECSGVQNATEAENASDEAVGPVEGTADA